MNTEIEVGPYRVKIVQEHGIAETNLFAAVATIRPAVTKLTDPDVVMGVGGHPIPARQDAFDRAKKLIADNSPPTR